MRLVIENKETRVVVVPERTRGTVVYARSAPGPQGPPGVGGNSYDHVQSSPSDTWIINHNMGVKPVVEAFTPGGLLMIAEVLHTSNNQTIISFNNPTTGFARLI